MRSLLVILGDLCLGPGPQSYKIHFYTRCCHIGWVKKMGDFYPWKPVNRKWVTANYQCPACGDLIIVEGEEYGPKHSKSFDLVGVGSES